MAAPDTDALFGECSGFDTNYVCDRQDPQDRFMTLLGFSDAGEAVFRSSLLGTDVRFGPDDEATNYMGIWSERGGEELHLVARMGDRVGVPAELLGSFDTGEGRSKSPRPTNDDGLVTFMTIVDRGAKTLWVEEADGGLRRVAETGGQAPGIDGGMVEIQFDQTIGHIDAVGNVAFHANFETGGGEIGRGIWVGSNDGLTPVALSGMPVPGVSENATFAHQGIFLNSSSDAGNLVFEGRWRDSIEERAGLFAAVGDEIRQVGDGIGEIDHAVIDDLGRVAFTNYERQLYAERNGEVILVAGPDNIPGLAENEVLAEIRT